MSRGARVKKEEYDFIKSRLANGEKAVDIAKQFKRSQEVVRNIDYSTDFNDFLKTPSKELRARKKKAKQLTVEDLCPLEENNKPEEHDQEPVPPSVFRPVDDIPISELSAKDKKELAMYAIDQHYFFLKQLTGVI